jgi:tRNA(Leu) C34 or U34 (ribose-2'-O)-methylase TrmL
VNADESAPRQTAKGREKAADSAALRAPTGTQQARNIGQMPTRHCPERTQAGYNVAQILRSALAMGTSAVHLVKVGPFDPSLASGAFRKVTACFHDCFDDARSAPNAPSYRRFAFSTDADIALPDVALPARSVFVFGHDECGLGFEAADLPDITWLRIPPR